MTIRVFNRQRAVRCNLAALRAVAPAALARCRACRGPGPAVLPGLAAVEVTLLSDRAIAAVHRAFLGLPGPTDVITFAHGEILIGAQTAAANARRFRSPLDKEIALCIIHGLLHLNGFADRSPHQQTTMKHHQTRILRAVAGRLAAAATAILLALLLPPAAVAEQDAPAVDAAAMLKTLRELHTQQATTNKQRLAAIIGEVNAAASSTATAMDFYRKVTRATKGDEEQKKEPQPGERGGDRGDNRGRGRNSQAASDRRRDENAALREHEVQEAVRLHLIFLSITLNRLNGSEIGTLVSPLLDFIEKADAAGPEVARETLMRTSIAAGPVAEYFQIQNWFAELKDWEMVPANTDAIAKKCILGELRSKRDPRLLTYWDYRLKTGEQKAAKGAGTDDFKNNIRPGLLWERTRDLALLGQRNRALTEFFGIYKAFPEHPSHDAWFSELEKMLADAGNGRPAAAPPPAATAAPPATPGAANPPAAPAAPGAPAIAAPPAAPAVPAPPAAPAIAAPPTAPR